MKKLCIAIAAIGILLVGGTPVHAAPTDNFTIDFYDAEMILGRDEKGHSTLKTILTITANFPPRQNHGLAPTFVKTYKQHPTDFTLVSVKDDTGKDLPYSWYKDELRIGDKDTYVEGRHTYVITYTQRYVTQLYKDTNKDEFYWDVIGVDWRVPILGSNIHVRLDDAIASARQTDMQCYIGIARSTNRCEVVRQGNSFVLRTGKLQRREGVTVALGFAPHTFVEYQPSLLDRFFEWWVPVQQVLLFVSFVFVFWLAYRYRQTAGRKKEVGTIIPEYIPPKGMSVLASAELIRPYDSVEGNDKAATLIDMAVRHYIKIHQTKEAGIFSSPEYSIEVIKDTTKLLAEEREFLDDMFGHTPRVGERLELKSLMKSMAYFRRQSDDSKNLHTHMTGEYELRDKSPAHRAVFTRYSKVLLIAAILLLSPSVLVLSLIAHVMKSSDKVLTDKGLAMYRYLVGLKLYIEVAEKKRLQMLQSPEGAEKVSVDVHDKVQLIKLYERVLPYAILFGQERQWTKHLGKYYEEMHSQPDWYAGQAAFNAAAFASGMSSLGSVASSYSSSSGGSSGGGW